MKDGDTTIPNTYKEVMSQPDAEKWQAVCKKEMGVWKEDKLPAGQRVTDTKWVFDIKIDGTYKALYVAQGFSQFQGVDFNETFAPTATFAAL